MAITSIGAIFATNSKLLQRIYIPHADDSEISQQPVASGETLIAVPLATFQSGSVPAVQAAIGAPTFSGRCAIVDATNKVIDHLTADPALYTDPRGQVIHHDHTNIGDTWDGTKFNRAYIELDHTTGLVVGTSIQPIDSVAPKVNAINIMANASMAPSAIIGASVPILTAKIVAAASAPVV
jgi:hypothetical protein